MSAEQLKLSSRQSQSSHKKFSLAFKVKQVQLFNKNKNLFSKRKFVEAISDDDGDNKIKRGTVGESTFRDWEKLVNGMSQEKLNSILSMKDNRYRDRDGKYVSVETELVKYIGLRNQLYKRDKLGINWNYLKHKAKLFSDKLLPIELKNKFSASDGWLENVLSRNGLCGVKLHGEAGDVNEEQAALKMIEFRKVLNEKMEKESITKERVANADQFALYYKKTPDRIYFDKQLKGTIKGAKIMKDKDRLTGMLKLL